MANPTWSDLPPPTNPPEPVPSPRYEDRGPLGQGGMGVVRRVYDRELERVVALKRLRVAVAERPSWQARFAREVRLTAQLQHPSVVPVYDFGEDDGGLWYTMREVQGQTLAVAWDGLAVERRFEVLLRVAEALAFAHSRRVVHRDLKPENIILGPFGEVVILDWGLARWVHDAEAGAPLDEPLSPVSGPALTRAGVAMGTPGFMSPEQERGEAVGPPADVWALGALVAGAAGGRAELLAVAARCRRPDPAERYPDAGALVAELRRWQAGERVAALEYPFWVELSRLGRRHRFGLTVAGAVGIGLLVAGALGVARVRVERDQALRHLAEAHAAHATEALADGNLVDAGLYAASSLALEERPDTRGAVLAALSAGLPVLEWEVVVPSELAFSLDPSLRLPGWRRDPRRACTALALSPDGRVAACGTPDGVLLIEDGVPRRIGDGAIGGLAIDGRGRLAVGLLAGGPTQIWDLSGGLLATLPGPRNATWTVSWLPDGRVLTTGGDGDVRVDGEVITSFGASLSNHSASPDGRWVVLPFGHVRSLVGEPSRNLHPSLATWTAAFSPGGGAIAGASWVGDADITLWSADGAVTGTIARHRGVVRALAFASADRLLSASEDGTVGHWPLGDSGVKQHAHDGGLTELKVAGDRLVTAGRDLRVRGWRLDPAPWGAQRVVGLPSTIGIVGQTVGSVGQDTTLRRWDLRTGAALPPEQVWAWGPYLDCGDGRPTVAGHEQVITRLDPYLQVSPPVGDREQISVDCDEGVIHLLERGGDPDQPWLRWRSVDVQTAALLHEREVPEGTSTLLAERGRVILGGGGIGPVEWTGGVPRPLPATGSGALAVGPDGLLAAGGVDGFVTLLPGFQRIAAHQGEVRDIAIAPDGQRMATAGRDGVTRLWSLPDAVLRAEWRIPPTDADSLAFEADGQTLWMAFVDGTLRPLRLRHLGTEGAALAELLGERTGMRLEGGRVVAR